MTNPTTLVQSTSKDSSQVSSAGIPTYSNLSPSQVSSDNSTSGIWVVGEGTIQLKPDLTILRIGVESKARSVREANKNATKAMDSINKIVKSFEVKEDKIQTVSYNISPEYEWQQPRGGGSSKRVLIGYVVSNTVVVQITKIDLEITYWPEIWSKNAPKIAKINLEARELIFTMQIIFQTCSEFDGKVFWKNKFLKKSFLKVLTIQNFVNFVN